MFGKSRSGRKAGTALRVALLCTTGLVLGACEIADAVHVRKGVSPQLADDNVRFRTTYYFRTLDVCESEDDGAGKEEDDLKFGDRMPAKAEQIFVRKEKIKKVLSDSLYRFTMTGKASPWSKVRFESGTLKSWQIDPFGASAAFDSKNGRFYWKSQASTQADARMSEDFKAVEQLMELSEKLKASNPEVAGGINSIILQRLGALNVGGASSLPLTNALERSATIRKRSVEAFKAGQEVAGETGHAPTNHDQPTPPKDSDAALDAEVQRGNAIEVVNGHILKMEPEVEYLNAVAGKAKTLAATAKEDWDKAPDAEKGAKKTIYDKKKGLAAQAGRAAAQARATLAEMKTVRQQLASTSALSASTPEQTGECGVGARFRRGFQLIGPEGVKLFDQDDRLIMAMSSSPRPVLSALQELSGRMLQQKAMASDRLLPLVQERGRLANAQNRAKGIASATPETLDGTLDQVLKALKTGEEK